MAVRTAALAGAALAIGLTACGTHANTPTAGATGTARPAGTVVVFAATSLTAAFTKIASEFEKAHPGVTVRFHHGGSSTLATQLTQGAPADVFASANEANMDTVTGHDLAERSPETFARNEGEIMVEKGNPKHISSVADLSRDGTKVVTCASRVPCGALAETIFKNAGVTVHPISQEQNVGGVVTKVSLGEADAGIVYVTDVTANEGKATGVPIPADHNAITSYPVAELKHASNAAGASAFIQYLRGPEGQHVLESYGFLPPGS